MRSAMSRLSVATGVLVFLLSVQSQAKIYRFDMGPEGSPVWKGFTQVTEGTVYSAKTGYGWRKKAGRGKTHRLRGVPDALICDLVGARDDAYFVYYSGEMEFLLDVPNGNHTVYLLTTDYQGSRMKRYVPLSYSVSAEGEVKVRVSLRDSEWMKRYAYPNLHTTYRGKNDVYEKYVATRIAPTIFTTDVKDARLNLLFHDTTVSGLIVYPTAQAQQGEAFIAELNKKRRASFRYEDATPRPKGRLQSVSPEERAKGYVVFYPHYMDTVRPFDLPEPEQRNKDLRAFASLGEYEPVTFAVHPIKDLGKCRVAVGDLAGERGAIIPASAWEIRVVRYLEIPDGRGARRYSVRPFMLMKRDVVHADQGINRQFWLTVKVPENARPGKYKGTVTFKPENARESKIILKLLVLPYKLRPLEDNGRYHGVWHTSTWLGGTIEQVARDLRNHGMNVIHTPPAPRAKLVDGKIVLDLKHTEAFLDAYRKAGFPMRLIVWQGSLRQAYRLAKEPMHDAVWLKAKGGGTDHHVKKSFSKEFDEIYKKLARAIDGAFKKRGWPKIYFYEAGEGGTEGYWGIWTETHLLKLMQEAGVIGTTSVVGLAALEAELPHLAVVQISDDDAPPSIRERIKKTGKPLWLYGFGGNRYERGFVFWKSGAEGCAFEGYSGLYGDPYNEFDGMYACEGRVLPSPDGPVPLLSWERVREGIDDCKYVSHLDLVIKQAMKSSSTSARDAAKEAQNVLDELMAEINPDFEHYKRHGCPDAGVLDVWRWKVANEIRKLQKSM